MGPAHWIKIAKTVEKHYFDYDGFVIITGTDTMCYCASACSFLFDNLAKPVVFTGSMIPLCYFHNDARKNLIAAMYVAGTVDIPEVCIFFHNKLYRANRCSKFDKEGLDPILSPNFPVLGELHHDLVLHDNYFLPPPKGRFLVHDHMNTNICVIHLVPGFSDEVVRNLIRDPIEGVILMTYGTGNVPYGPSMRKENFLTMLADAIERGVVVIVCSQCAKGSVRLSSYTGGASLKKVGAISSYDMTVEATATKLGFLLGLPISVGEVERLMQIPLRGEMTVRNEKEKQDFLTPVFRQGFYKDDENDTKLGEVLSSKTAEESAGDRQFEAEGQQPHSV